MKFRVMRGEPLKHRQESKGMDIGVPLASLMLAVYIAIVLNGAFWREAMRIIPTVNVAAWVFHVALCIAVISAYAFALNILIMRVIGKPIMIFLVLLGGVVAYFMDTFGVRIDRTMIMNVLQTDFREASDFITYSAFFRIGAMGVFPALIIYKLKISRLSFGRELLRRIVFGGLCMIFFVTAIGIQYKEMISFFRANRQMRTMLNPFNALDAAITLGIREWGDRNVVIRPLGRDAVQIKQAPKPRLVVMVVGEAARAMSFSLNGYERETNPELKKLDIFNFNDVSSCGTSTAVSLPCMFSAYAKADYTDRIGREYENLLDVLNHAKVKVVWLDNNSGSKKVAERVGEVPIYDLRVDGICNSGGCYDEILLQEFDKYLDKAKAEQQGDIVMVLHQKGSHGPSYYLRYPEQFKKFLPECASTELQTCTEEAVKNTYDNTILYTDYFLAQVVKKLKTYDNSYETAMIYMSDHGESTGEYGLYLHGVPYVVAPDEQTKIPLLMWFSQQFAQSSGLKKDCFKQQVDKGWSHDNLFHSVLGIMDVKSSVYSKELDIFALCRE